MKKIRFKALLWAPYFSAPPAGRIENWAKGMLARKSDTLKQSLRTIKGQKDFDDKIGSKMLEDFSLRCDKNDPHYEEMMNKTRCRLEKAGKKYREKLKTAYETKKFENGVEFGKQFYEKTWLTYLGPLYGDKKSKVKGLPTLGVMALTADSKLANFLKKTDNPHLLIAPDKIEGNPFCIVAPDKLGEFKRIVRGQLIRSGKEVIMIDFMEKYLRNHSQIINQLVEQYRLPEIAPFSPGGVSHIDFIVGEIPDPVKPETKKKWLGLEIQVAEE